MTHFQKTIHQSVNLFNSIWSFTDKEIKDRLHSNVWDEVYQMVWHPTFIAAHDQVADAIYMKLK